MDAEVLNDALGALVAIEAELGIAPSGVWPTLIARLDAFIVGSVAVPQLIVAGAGPHAIGGAVVPSVQQVLQGTFGERWAFSVRSTIQPPDGANAALIETFGTITRPAAGNLVNVAAARFGPPTLDGTGTATNAATVHITAAPTGATNNYALWVAGGNVRLDGTLSVTSSITTTMGILALGSASGEVTLGASGATGNAVGAAGSSTAYLLIAPSVAGASSLRIPHGTAPTSPVNGDIWTTTAGLFVRINGVTVGPLS